MLENDDILLPFRMQPGLSALPEQASLLHALGAHSPLHRERLLLCDQALLQVTDFDDHPARLALAQQAFHQGLPTPEPNSPDFWPQASLLFEEDFAVLDTVSGRVMLLQVCNPSRWAPEEKIGLHFTQIHAPVADAQAIERATPALMRLLADGRRWQRRVWSLTPQQHHDLHPNRCPADHWPDFSDPTWSQQVWLRVEEQCFFPVHGASGQLLFTIRVRLQVLSEWARASGRCVRLRASLASMTPSVQTYKGLHAVMPDLLVALDRLEQSWAQ